MHKAHHPHDVSNDQHIRYSKPTMAANLQHGNWQTLLIFFFPLKRRPPSKRKLLLTILLQSPFCRLIAPYRLKCRHRMIGKRQGTLLPVLFDWENWMAYICFLLSSEQEIEITMVTERCHLKCLNSDTLLLFIYFLSFHCAFIFILLSCLFSMCHSSPHC